MPSRIRTTEELQNAATAVGYEITMLIFSAQHLDDRHSSPATPPIGQENLMALESFLLHFRNLRAFLCPSLSGRVYPDDVVASDFLGIDDASDVGDPAKFTRDDGKRLDKMLAHVTYSRADYIKAGNHWWDKTAMLTLTLSELQKFFLRLSATQRAWFPRINP